MNDLVFESLLLAFKNLFNNDNDALTVEDAQAYLGGKSSPLHKDTLSRWRSNGSGPKFVKYGNGKTASIRYMKKDLDAFIKECTIDPETKKLDLDD